MQTCCYFSVVAMLCFFTCSRWEHKFTRLLVDFHQLCGTSSLLRLQILCIMLCSFTITNMYSHLLVLISFLVSFHFIMIHVNVYLHRHVHNTVDACRCRCASVLPSSFVRKNAQGVNSFDTLSKQTICVRVIYSRSSLKTPYIYSFTILKLLFLI